MDALAHRQHHARVRVLPLIKTLDDCFGDFLVPVERECGAITAPLLAALITLRRTVCERSPQGRERRAWLRWAKERVADRH